MKDINLLPEDIKSTTVSSPNAKAGSIGISAKAIAILVVVLLFIGASLAAPKVYIMALEANLAKVEKEIEDPKYDEVKKVRADLSAIDGVIGSKSDVMNTIDTKSYPINEVLVAVNGVVPAGCKITSMEYKGTDLKISGYADNSIAIAELVSKIQRLDFVEIKSDITVDQTNLFTLEMSLGRKEGN